MPFPNENESDFRIIHPLRMKFPSLTASLALLLGLLAPAQASPAFDAARGLFEQHHFREAETALRAVITAEPANAAACHTLARAIVGRLQQEKPAKEENDAAAKDVAQWIARATELEPTNAAYLRDFGMSQITGVTTLKKGRKVMEQALLLDPKDADTHELLAFLYGVPWMLGGDKDKAAEHRKALRELDPPRAALNEMNRLLWIDKNFPAAISMAETQLQNEPESAVSHFIYGSVAATTKTNLERGLASLKKALTLPIPVPTGNSAYGQPFPATPSNFWEKIGEIEGQLGHTEAARAAFTTAVELDPANYWAAKALEKPKV